MHLVQTSRVMNRTCHSYNLIVGYRCYLCNQLIQNAKMDMCTCCFLLMNLLVSERKQKLDILLEFQYKLVGYNKSATLHCAA